MQKKESENQYIWVAERQTKMIFQGEYSFHMITNKYWKIENGGITGLTYKEKTEYTKR
jgi:hypothetical protein